VSLSKRRIAADSIETIAGDTSVCERALDLRKADVERLAVDRNLRLPPQHLASDQLILKIP
jgi:hypothetical protein